MVPATREAPNVTRAPVLLQAITFHWTLKDLANKTNRLSLQSPLGLTPLRHVSRRRFLTLTGTTHQLEHGGILYSSAFQTKTHSVDQQTYVLHINWVFRAIPIRPNKTNRHLGVLRALGPERRPIVSANTLLKQIHRDVKFMVAPAECSWTKELCCIGVVRGRGDCGCCPRFSNH